jgi:hypothetical protein
VTVVPEGEERNPPIIGAEKPSRAIAPSSKTGWWALALAACAAVSWTALPVLGLLVFGEQNSGSFMLAAMVLAVAATIFNLLAVTVWRQRSVLNIVAVVVTVPNAVIAIAEGVSFLVGSR